MLVFLSSDYNFFCSDKGSHTTLGDALSSPIGREPHQPSLRTRPSKAYVVMYLDSLVSWCVVRLDWKGGEEGGGGEREGERGEEGGGRRERGKEWAIYLTRSSLITLNFPYSPTAPRRRTFYNIQ